jgi:hypothetical protein
MCSYTRKHDWLIAGLYRNVETNTICAKLTRAAAINMRRGPVQRVRLRETKSWIDAYQSQPDSIKPTQITFTLQVLSAAKPVQWELENSEPNRHNAKHLGFPSRRCMQPGNSDCVSTTISMDADTHTYKMGHKPDTRTKHARPSIQLTRTRNEPHHLVQII